MITLNLKEIFETTDRFVKSYVLKPKEVKLPSEVGEIKEETFVNLEVRKAKGGYLVSLEIRSGIYLECSRCLEVYRKDIDYKVYKKLEAPSQERELFLQEKDLSVSFMEKPDILNLTQLVREELILSVPMKPLCSPSCHGVVEVLPNEEAHPDPRFAILKSLLTPEGGEK